MSSKYFKIYVICILLFSCEKSFEEIHGRIIPNNDRYFKIENILNEENKFNANEYDEETIYSDDEKYFIKIYVNKKIRELEKYSDEYIHTFIFTPNKFNSVLNVIRVFDNKEIIYGFNINPNSKILVHNDRIYCYTGNIVYELNLLNFTKKAKYVHDKSVDVQIINIIDKYLILQIEEHGLYNDWESGYIPIKKEFKIKLKS